MQVLYDTWLVLLSIAVAMLASYAALTLASRITMARSVNLGRAWLAGGALSMGTGIWSMHFVGMLAASLPIRMAYDIALTLASLLIAVVVSGFALRLVSGASLSRRDLASGGIVMGCGISGMHYVGMAAMEVAPAIRYDPLLFLASIAIAILASDAALWLAFRLRSESMATVVWKRAGSAVVMGLAIAGMHYTAMAAARFAPGSVCTTPVGGIDSVWLGIAVGGLSFLLLATTLLLSVFDAHLADHAARHAEKLERLNSELECRVRQRTSQMETANKQLEAFSYSIAHDLRAPLTAIDGFRRLLAESEPDSANGKRQHYHERIHAAVERMAGLIDALLALAQISRASLEWSGVDLSAIAKSLLASLRESQPEREVRYRVEEGLIAEGDPRLLGGVMENLVHNAWKFTSRQAGGDIEVGRLPGDTGPCVFYVRDNGAGFDMAYAGKLFHSFQRLHTSDDFVGTGVGLANVQRVLERHGGRIWAESAPGKGATFFFTIGPRHSAPAPLESSPQR